MGKHSNGLHSTREAVFGEEGESRIELVFGGEKGSERDEQGIDIGK